MNRSLVAVLLLLSGCLLAWGCASSDTAATPEAGSGEPPLRAGFLVLEGVFTTDLTAPLDVFHHTASHIKPGMRVVTVGRSREPVKTFEGLTIRPDHDLATAPELDVLVVPGGKHSMEADLEDLDLIDWISRRGVKAKHVVAFCDGTFLLAEAGLLRETRCTTFPEDIPAFQKAYPHIRVEENVSFVEDGKVLTSVGGVKSFEAALHLVEKLYGKKVAEGVAAGLMYRSGRKSKE